VEISGRKGNPIFGQIFSLAARFISIDWPLANCGTEKLTPAGD
jgi:hypothetical protein